MTTPLSALAALLALGLAGAAPLAASAAAAGSSGVFDGIWAELGAAQTVADRATQEDADQPTADQTAQTGDAAPEATAEAADEAAEAGPPRVFWFPPSALVYGHGPDAFSRVDLEARLAAARSRLDDSARFPPRGALRWRHHPATGDYAYFAHGRWHRVPRPQGYFDQYGNWHPGGWHDGMWRRGPQPAPVPGPCACMGW